MKRCGAEFTYTSHLSSSITFMSASCCYKRTFICMLCPHLYVALNQNSNINIACWLEQIYSLQWVKQLWIKAKCLGASVSLSVMRSCFVSVVRLLFTSEAALERPLCEWLMIRKRRLMTLWGANGTTYVFYGIFSTFKWNHIQLFLQSVHCFAFV